MIAYTQYNPGIYSISNEEYHSSNGISRSGIVEFKHCPKKFWNKYLNPYYIKHEPTKSLTFGNAFHTAILEPNEFDQRYITKPEDKIIVGKPLRLKDVGRDAFEADKIRIADTQALKSKTDEEFELKAQGKTILSRDESHMINRMQYTLLLDSDSRQLIEGAQYEKSIYWIDEQTQILCKVRPDIMHDNFIVDLKTTENASYYAFQRSLYNYNYHLQMAMIQEAILHTSGKLLTDFIVLCIEKEEPYCHATYIFEDAVIERGRDEFRKYLRLMKQCFDENSWPSYPTQVIDLPTYAKYEEI